MAGGEEKEAHRRPRGRGLIGDVPAPVTILAALLALIFIALSAAPASIEDFVGARYGLSPARLAAGASGPDGLAGAIAPLFTHTLIHASAPHLLFNLLWLAVFGTLVARRFQSYWRFFAYFAFCGAAGGAFFSLFHLEDPTLLIGASGGISGLLGGVVRFALHRPYSRPASAKGVLPVADRSVLTWSAVVIAMNASVAIFGADVAGGAEIAWQAHVGGYLFGLVFFPAFDPKRV
jgi:membrane associated rhomboid family serine protease